MKKKRAFATKELTEKVFAEKLRLARLEGQTDAYVERSISANGWRVIPYESGYKDGYEKGVRSRDAEVARLRKRLSKKL